MFYFEIRDDNEEKVMFEKRSAVTQLLRILAYV